MPAFCAVVGCGNRAERDRFRFYRIPAALKNRGIKLDAISRERRNAWVRALRRGSLSDTYLKHARICSKHFVSGAPADLNDEENPDWIPTLYMGYNTIKEQSERNKRSKKKCIIENASVEAGPSKEPDVGTKAETMESRVRSIHFDEDSFEISLKQKLLNYCPKNTRNLKADALPVLHLPHFMERSTSKHENQLQMTNEGPMLVEVADVENSSKNKDHDFTMPGRICAVASCKNNQLAAKKQGLNLVFHQFPKGNYSTIRRQWVHLCKRKDKFNAETSTVCSEHFTPSDYERDLQHELLGLPVRRILKKTAVPTLNLGKGIKSTLKTTSLEANRANPSTSHKECIIKEKKRMQRRSKKPNILKRSSKVSRSTSPNKNLKNVDFLEEIKSQNPNIEVEYVDVKMDNEDDIVKIVDEPNNVIDDNTSNVLADDIVKIVDEPNNVIDDNTSDDLVVVGSSLESKYNDLYKENQLLKQLLTKIGAFSNLECNGEYTINTDSNQLIDMMDIQNICRVCLQKSDDLISVIGQMVFENKHIPNMTILEALQSIICDKVDIADNLPRQICMQCRNQLKSFIMFKHRFNRGTLILRIFANGTFVNTNNQPVAASAMEDHDYSKKKSLKDEKCCNIELETSETDTITADDMSVLSKNSEDLSKLRSPTRRKIFRHNIKKQMNKLHTCPLCWTKMSMSKLIPHVKSHKTLQKYLSIPKVSLKTRFYAPARDVQGLLNGESEKLHKCPICRYEFKAAEFILHVHHHLTHDQFKCEKCHRSFKKKQYMLSHMFVVHSKTFPYRCVKCGKGFVIKSNYECHLLTHEDGELPHKCIECGKGFSNPKYLSRHMTIHTDSTKYRYKRCKYCGEGFSKKEQLVEHVCHQYGVYKCKYCFKVFLNSRMRQLHTHKVHFNGKKNPGYCPICNLTFKNINYHKASKHPKKKMKALCTVCGLYITNIYTHMRKHRNVSTTQHYQCPICSKLFSYRTTLNKHLTIHSGVKPYICSFCGKAFNFIYDLQVHERIHVGDRCHVCPVCDKGFLEKSYLNRHMKTHKDVDVLSS